MPPHISIEQASPWVARFASLIPDGEVLDLACGSGRHARLLAGMGHPVVAVDRNVDALAQLSTEAGGIATLCADLEQDADAGKNWPFAAARFAAIVVTNYLHRPLFPYIFGSLAEGGVLIYETFALGNAAFGKPSNPDFLLQPGELLARVQGSGAEAFHILAYEEGYVERPKPAMVQRICAIKAQTGLLPARLRLD